MKIPTGLKHKPVLVVENYEQVDGRSAYDSQAKGLSIGLAQWNDRGRVDASAKVWRYTGEKWSRQSEELPLHRVLDLAILLARSEQYPVSYTHLDVYKRQGGTPPARIRRWHSPRGIPTHRPNRPRTGRPKRRRAAWAGRWPRPPPANSAAPPAGPAPPTARSARRRRAGTGRAAQSPPAWPGSWQRCQSARPRQSSRSARPRSARGPRAKSWPTTAHRRCSIRAPPAPWPTRRPKPARAVWPGAARSPRACPFPPLGVQIQRAQHVL